MALSLDIGATNIRIAEVSGAKIKNKKSSLTPKRKSEIIKEIFKLISSYKNYDRLCVALAGFEKDGKIQGALNSDFNGVSLKKILEKEFKVRVLIQNDARCAALAELNFGAGKEFTNFVMLTLGTGIGGAIVINKKLYLGGGTAGEVGSMFIEKNKIFENLASGPASAQFAKELGLNVTNSELHRLAIGGDKTALEIYKKVGRNLGAGLANLSFILDPDAFVIGGGFSAVNQIFPEARKTFKELYTYSKIKIVKARFSEDAGLIGAGLLEKEHR